MSGRNRHRPWFRDEPWDPRSGDPAPPYRMGLAQALELAARDRGARAALHDFWPAILADAAPGRESAPPFAQRLVAKVAGASSSGATIDGPQFARDPLDGWFYGDGSPAPDPYARAPVRSTYLGEAGLRLALVENGLPSYVQPMGTGVNLEYHRWDLGLVYRLDDGGRRVVWVEDVTLELARRFMSAGARDYFDLFR
jgi:hypothetical protein